MDIHDRCSWRISWLGPMLAAYALAIPGCAERDHASSGDSGGTGTTDDSSASDGGGESCGDGIIDVDEQCDDANDVANDGCTECRLDDQPGEAAWRVVLPGFAVWNRGHSDPILIGFYDGAAWGIARYDASGQQTLYREFADPAGATVGAIADDEQDNIVIGGEQADVPWLVMYDPESDEVRTLAVEPREGGELKNVAIDSTGRVVAGGVISQPPQSGWFEKLDLDESVLWTVEGFTLDHGVALGRDDEMALALFEGGPPVVLLASDGSVLWDNNEPVDEGAVSHHAATVWTPDGGDTFMVCGTADRFDGSSTTVMWVRAFARDGTIKWTTLLPELLESNRLIAPLTVLDDGRVPILSPPGWNTVRLLDADGQVLWNLEFPGSGRPIGLLPLASSAIGIIRVDGFDNTIERHDF